MKNYLLKLIHRLTDEELIFMRKSIIHTLNQIKCCDKCKDCQYKRVCDFLIAIATYASIEIGNR